MLSATENLGIITFLMMRSPNHLPWTLNQLQTLAMPALQHKMAVTATTPTNNGATQPLAFALFAKVDDQWDAKLRDPTFDVTKLPADAWISGGNKWMVEFLTSQKASGHFVEKAARAVFPNGGTLHVRGRGENGTAEIGKRRF